MKDVLVPDIGDFKDVEVIEVLVKPGDTVAKEQSLVSLESDKATMEIPSPEAGVVKELKIKVGDRVSQGSVILKLEPGDAPKEAAKAKPAESARPAAATPVAPVAPAPSAPSVVTRVEPVPAEPKDALAALPHASPSIRKFARELGVDLGRVQGSGPKGRILKEDVQAYVKGALAGRPALAAAPAGKGGGLDVLAWPDVDFAKFGPIELKARSRIQKLSAANLHRNWVMIPHVTHNDEADITDLEAFRKSNTAETEKQGFKLTMLAFLIKASVTALRQFPDFNASIDKSGENLVMKKYFHIGLIEVLKRLNQIYHEPRGAAAVDDAVIVGKRDRQNQARFDFIFLGHDGFHRAFAHAENRDFGLVHNWCEMRSAKCSLIGNGERAALQFFHRNFAVASFDGEFAQLFGDLHEIFFVCVAKNRDHQSLI